MSAREHLQELINDGLAPQDAQECDTCHGRGGVEWEVEYGGRVVEQWDDCPDCGGMGWLW